MHSDRLAQHNLGDSLTARIGRFDPSVNASFEESDIKFMSSDLKDMYEKNAWDFRYKVFYHTAQFYDMWFADKKILWSKQSNVARFRTNLEKCEMGVTRKEDVLNQIQNNKLNESIW